MHCVLEITSEPAAGKRFWLRSGQTADIGRSDHAAFTLPHDRWMSSLHFRVECDACQCRLRDLDSRNGTTVNGQTVATAFLADGDVIVAGETVFRVHLEGVPSTGSNQPATVSDGISFVPDVSSACRPRHRVGHWVCNVVPDGWEIMPNQGMRSSAEGIFPTTLLFSETVVDQDFKLQEHVATLIEQYLDALPGCRTEGATEVKVAGSDESRQFLLEHPLRGDIALRQRYICVRQRGSIGMAVLTTSLTELERAGSLLVQILEGLAWEE